MIALMFGLQLAVQPPYWQQRVRYQIDAALDEQRGLLSGTQRVDYLNHSPDTLRTVSFHLYLNAFRPGSRWADRDSIEGRRRFNDLLDPDFGLNRVANATVMGVAATPTYPFAPDSTIVRFALPAPLAPGDSMTVTMDWIARPSTVPRRQGRSGRAFDFAQWYPRVVAYDKGSWQEHPLYPAGEFYGEFGEYTVRLDVPDDQVVGSTGVPLCGDPGWERANVRPERPVNLQRGYYVRAAATLPADACAGPAPGRKKLVWHAEDVHHFAMSMRPDYRYEGGEWGGVQVHVLYQPGDETTWGGNIATKRTEVALEWLDGLFGRYPWPQITNVHRIEGGGTEFPMMVHDGSADQELILHEVGHNYLMGILANNEWKEGFLDEGFTSFQTSWFFEEKAKLNGYPELEREILHWDLDDRSEPTSLAGEHYRDFGTYGAMVYARGELFFHQLREIVGDDALRRILRTYYDRWKLAHVDETTFRLVAEEVSRRDLSGFFAQWLHGTTLYDYAVGQVRTSKQADGNWATRVEIKRQAPGVFPVDVVVRTKTDSVVTRYESPKARGWIEVVTTTKPRSVSIDPGTKSHDWNITNNHKARGWFGWGSAPPRDFHVDPVFSTRVHRDRVAEAWLPMAWYNAAGGVMIGTRHRSNYLGRFNRLSSETSIATKRCCGSDQEVVGMRVALTNPTWLHAPRLSTRFEGFTLEGRYGAALGVERQRVGRAGSTAASWASLGLQWMATSDTEFLDRGLWDNAGTVEATGTLRTERRRGPWQLSSRATVGLGVEYRNRTDGVTTADRYDAQLYARLHGELAGSRPIGARGRLDLRAFGGWLHGASDPVRQRWFYLAGGDPYQQFANPLVRSRDALLTNDFHFQTPGGPELRGFERDVAVTRVAALNVQYAHLLGQRPGAKLAREVKVAGFADLAWSDGFFTTSNTSGVAADLGVGLHLEHHIGTTTFTTRFDVPFLVAQPDRAIGGRPGDGAFGLRWVIGVR